MKLSPHFALSEFTASQTATRWMLDNTPGPDASAAMKLLCRKVLEPVREHFGKPVRISSGFRSEAVNRALRGSRNSQHVLGEAADFEITGIDNLRICQWMERDRKSTRLHSSHDQISYAVFCLKKKNSP